MRQAELAQLLRSKNACRLVASKHFWCVSEITAIIEARPFSRRYRKPTACELQSDWNRMDSGRKRTFELLEFD